MLLTTSTYHRTATLQMSPTLQTLMLHDTGGAGLTRAHSGSTLGHSKGRGLGGSSGPNGGQPGQPVGSGEGGGTPVEFDPSQMEGKYSLDLERPWDAWVRGSMIYVEKMNIYMCVRACVRLCICMHAHIHIHIHMHMHISGGAKAGAGRHTAVDRRQGGWHSDHQAQEVERARALASEVSRN